MAARTELVRRVAIAEDAPAIAALHAASWRSTYRGVFRDSFLDGPVEVERRAIWSERLASPSPSQFVVVAVDASALRGFVCAYREADPGWGVFIDNLHVTTERKATGIGTALLHAAAVWAVGERPSASPYLWVLEPNVHAQRFYERRGGAKCDAVVLENPGGGRATYLRYAWTNPAEMAARCRAR